MDMPFPFTWTWTIHWPQRSSTSADVQPEINSLAEALRRKGAKIVVSRPEQVQFASPGVAHMAGWALLGPISGGLIAAIAEAGGAKLTYTLSFVRVFWPSLAAGIIFALLSFGDSPLVSGIVSFFLLFFGNIAISLLRFRAFIRRVLSENSPTST